MVKKNYRVEEVKDGYYIQLQEIQERYFYILGFKLFKKKPIVTWVYVLEVNNVLIATTVFKPNKIYKSLIECIEIIEGFKLEDAKPKQKPIYHYV